MQKQLKNICITADINAIWQHAATTTDQLTCLTAAKQEPHKNAYLLTKNTEEFSGKKDRRMGQQAEKKKAGRVKDSVEEQKTR